MTYTKGHPMRRNPYDGVVEEWKVRLMASRARRLGFRGDEIDDALQDLVLDVLAFRFDPAKSNGASEATALTAVIDKRLRTIRRGWRRYRSHLAALRAELGVGAARDRWPEPAEDQTPILILDVRAAIAQLPPRERRLCRQLLADQTLADVARHRGCDWHVPARILARARRRFEALGLRGWLS